MITILLVSVGLLIVFVLCPLIWLCQLAPRSDPIDRAVLAPVVAIALFAACSGIAQFVPWSFRLQATAAFVLLASSVLLLALRRVREELARCLRRAWRLLVPAACCFLAVAAFGVVQGDPPATLAYPGTLLSARRGEPSAGSPLPRWRRAATPTPDRSDDGRILRALGLRGPHAARRCSCGKRGVRHRRQHAEATHLDAAAREARTGGTGPPRLLADAPRARAAQRVGRHRDRATRARRSTASVPHSSRVSWLRRTRSSSRTRSSRGRRCSPRTSCCCITHTCASVGAAFSPAVPPDWRT